VTILDGAAIGMRATIIGHFREAQGVTIEENAFIGPGAIILPGTVIGQGAVVTAGSIVAQRVPPMTVVQGNPAKPVATVGLLLTAGISVKAFSKHLKSIHAPVSNE
jgi:acetyltransferase-like isoleucine patch superfamily enzyme